MEGFTQLFQALDATPATTAKVRSLQAYFQTAPPADQGWALYLLLGKTRRRTVTARLLRQTFLAVSDLPEWLFQDCYAQVGDSAEVIALLLRHTPLPPAPRLDLPLHQWMESIIPQVKAAQDDSQRQALILSWWAGLDSDQILVLNKILTGAFRVGVSEKLVIKGLAAATGLEEAVLAQRLMGEFTPSLEFYQALIQPSPTAAPPSQPYPFFLASPLELDRFTPDPCSDWLAEWKWDGIRAQVIRRADQ
ncbi:MAG: ATP-dependent DNA ligase, partial [Nodosilinea sp.]